MLIHFCFEKIPTDTDNFREVNRQQRRSIADTNTEMSRNRHEVELTLNAED